MAKTRDDYEGNDPRYPSQQQDRFIVRLPDGMRERIKAAAEKNNRSMNAEIVAVLEDKFPQKKAFDFNAFLVRFLMVIPKTKTKAERHSFVKAANRFLDEERIPDVRVWLEESEGNSEARLYMRFQGLDMMLNKWKIKPDPPSG